MADDAKADEYVNQLRGEFAAAITRAVCDIPAHHALQLADSLCMIQADVLAGKRITYRAKPVIDADAIAEDWRRGLSIGEITTKHKISRTAAYKHHPAKSTGHSGTG